MEHRGESARGTSLPDTSLPKPNVVILRSNVPRPIARTVADLWKNYRTKTRAQRPRTVSMRMVQDKAALSESASLSASQEIPHLIAWREAVVGH
jgi:hypothetical protein